MRSPLPTQASVQKALEQARLQQVGLAPVGWAALEGEEGAAVLHQEADSRVQAAVGELVALPP